MEFDRKGLEGGLEIYTTVESGRAYLECKVYFRKAVAEELLEEAQTEKMFLEFRMWDRENRLVFSGNQTLGQEEPMKGLLLHPHLWQGTEDPYLYRMQVSVMAKRGMAVDRIETVVAFRSFREHPRKGWFLNDSPFQVRAVAYEIPPRCMAEGISGRDAREVRIRRDLELIGEMGANTIYPVKGELDREFCGICDELGLVVWCFAEADAGEGQADIPAFYGTEEGLLTLRGRALTERYYFYKACWSKEPFVYINAESLRYRKNGSACVTVYSNQKKVALYVEGVLFEFQTEGPDFLFEEIPVKRLPLMLTAEAGECSMSVTAMPLHRNFTE